MFAQLTSKMGPRPKRRLCGIEQAAPTIRLPWRRARRHPSNATGSRSAVGRGQPSCFETVFCQRLLCLMASTIDRGRRVNSIRRSRRDQAVSPAGGARRATKTKVRGLTHQVLTEDEPGHGCVRVIRPDSGLRPGLKARGPSSANSGNSSLQIRWQKAAIPARLGLREIVAQQTEIVRRPVRFELFKLLSA